MKISPDNWSKLIVLMQMLFHVTSILLIYKMLLKYSNSVFLSFIFSLAIGINPNLLYFISAIVPTQLFGCFLVINLFLFLTFWNNYKKTNNIWNKYFFVFGLFSAFTVTLRSMYFFGIIPFVISMIILKMRKKIWIIPSGSKSIECSPEIIKKGQKIKIISVFRFVWEKNITGNLVFIKMLKEKYPNIEYCIYGSGAHLGQIHYLIHRLNISDVVKVKGYNPNKELKRKYLEFNYYLQLSISESLSMTVIEAQQRGLVPIVSNIGGLKDLVQDGQTGIIKDFTDYENLVDDTIKLHQNPEAHNKISRQCIENIKNNYTTEIEVDRIIKMYKTISEIN